MTDWRERKSVLVGLVALACGVWGYNAYQVTGALSEPAVPAASSPEAAPLPRSFERGSFGGHFRDPFSPVRSPIRGAEPVAEEEEMAYAAPAQEPIRLPGFRLVGIVGKTALIVASDGRTRAVKAGEHLEGVGIRRVEPDAVELDVQGETLYLELSLQPDLFSHLPDHAP